MVKKFIYRILFFSVVSAFLYVLFLLVFGEFVNGVFLKNLNYKLKASGFTDLRVKDVENYKDVDILFIGSSHVYRGFDTRVVDEYGYKSFNLGTSSQSHIQSYILLKRYIEILNPKMIVYDVYPTIFNTDGVESSLDLLLNDSIDIEMFNTVIKQNNLKLYNTLIYSFIKQFFNSKITFTNKEEENSLYISGGFVESNKFFNNNNNKANNINKKEWQPKEIQIDYFEKSIDLINSKNVELILVQIPVNKSISNKYSNKKEYENYFINKAIYYNFNNLIEMDDRNDFYDIRHLNTKGADKFTHFFMKEIVLQKAHKKQ